jgi:GNAT superfamily N-acetyltransferase
MAYAFTYLGERIQSESVLTILKKLHAHCFPADTMPDFHRGHWWLIKHRGDPVAFCGVEKSKQWQGTGYLCRAGVIREHRGRGLQSRMIQVRERFSRKMGWSHLISDTRDNHPSANNLARHGFKMYDPRSPWAWNNSLYWIKKIT